jgi:lipid-binding SYLF domain-containing protein
MNESALSKPVTPCLRRGLSLFPFPMKKFLLLSLALFTGASLFAATAEEKRRDYVTRVETCEAIIQEFMMRPETAIPASVLRQARAIVIVNQFKAGFLFGFKGGYGVVLVKQPNGRWSLPVLISASEASVGLQLGANTVETIYVITDDATPRLLFNRRFNVGVDAKAVAGPKVASKESNDQPIIAAPVLVYTKAVGLYAGATVKSGQLARNDEANYILYNTKYTMPELLYSDWVQPPIEVQPLMAYLNKIAP